MALRYPHQLVYEFLTPGQRLELWYEVSMFDREIRKQKLRREHPHWSELEVMNEIIRQAFAPEPVPDWLERRLQQRSRSNARANSPASNNNSFPRYTL